MKTVLSIFLLCCMHFAVAQIINTGKIYKTDKSFKEMEDSISALLNPANSIICKPCNEYKAYYLMLQDKHWKGFYIENTGDSRWSRNCNYSFFNGDSLYVMLKNAGIYNLEQLTEDSIRRLAVENGKTEFENNPLPVIAYDCDMTVILYADEKRTIRYRSSLADRDYLRVIPSLKIIYDLSTIFIKQTKKYYR